MAHLTANYLNEDIASESNLRDKTTIAKKRSKIASNDDVRSVLIFVYVVPVNCPLI